MAFYVAFVCFAAVIVISCASTYDILGHNYNGSTGGLIAENDECVCRSLCSLVIAAGVSCPWNRTLPEDVRCPCCIGQPLCSRQVNESCDHDFRRCDAELGLRCDDSTRVCKGSFELQISEVSHNSTTLTWSTSSHADRRRLLQLLIHLNATSVGWTDLVVAVTAGNNDVLSTASVNGLLIPNTVYFMRLQDALQTSTFETVILRTKEGCVQNGTSYAVGQQFNSACNGSCYCRRGGSTECSTVDTCNIYPQMQLDSSDNCTGISLNDTSCCNDFVCGSVFLEKAESIAKIILTGRTPVSLTFAWDDFRVPGPNSEDGYVIDYSVFPVVTLNSSSFHPWTRIQVGTIPMATINNLHPNLHYAIKIFVRDDKDFKAFSPSAAFTILKTEDGCILNGKGVSVGHVFYKGCIAKCECMGNNTVECGRRCSFPLQSVGSLKLVENCTEEAVTDDLCCVMIRCKSKYELIPNGAVRECPVRLKSPLDTCQSACKSDKDCFPEKKCCLSECGSSICAVPVVNNYPSCSCGRNADCLTDGHSRAKCKCFPGYYGDPYDGCYAGTTSQAKSENETGRGCVFANSTYAVGEIFFSGCEYKCQCNNKEDSTEVLCQPRCADKFDKVDFLNSACHLVADSQDECCKLFVCSADDENDANNSAKAGLSINSSTSSEASCVHYRTSGCSLDSDLPVKPGCEKIGPLRNLCSNVTSQNMIKPLLANQSSKAFHLQHEVLTTRKKSVPSNVSENYNDSNSSENHVSRLHLFRNRLLSGDFSVGQKLSNSSEIERLANETATEASPDANDSIGGRDYTSDISAPGQAADSGTRGEEEDVSRDSLFLTATSKNDDLLVNWSGQKTTLIYKVLPVSSSTVRMQVIMSPPIMKKLFAADDAVAILFTNNLTDNLAHWNLHSLAVQQNVAFVSVDRSEVVVETIITELESNREYYFVVVTPTASADTDHGLQYEKLSDIQATVTIQLDGACEFMGKTFRTGERIYVDCPSMCDCLPGRRVHCAAVVCHHQINPEKTGCFSWYTDPTFISRAPHCCPDATCEYGSTCVFDGHRFRNLEKIPDSLIKDCSQSCKCIAGNVTCVDRCPPVPTVPPIGYDCTQKLTFIPGDECCLGWFCEPENSEAPMISSFPTVIVQQHASSFAPVDATDNSTSDNYLNGTSDSSNSLVQGDGTVSPSEDVVFSSQDCNVGINETRKINEQWHVGKGHRQKTCTCILLSNGSAVIECVGGCPEILKQHLGLIPDCPPDNVVILDVPDLCPYVVCNKTDVGRGVVNVTVEISSSTSIRVTFVIPNIYVGLYGHVEILYTWDLQHSNDTTTWSKEIFSGPSNQFENTKLSHEINGLQQDTEYLLKVQVVIKNTKNVDTSDVVTFRMPSVTTTAKTTTTTTLPPKITLDVRLNTSVDVQPTSLRVSWRSFDATERHFIDGVQLKYRLDESDQWSQTALIHRDVTNYVLEDLKPNSSYEVDMIFMPVANVSTELVSSGPVTFQTLPVHDDYEFNLTLIVDKVTANNMELIWTGVPYPEQKYVHVYRVLYTQTLNSKQLEPAFLYRPPKGNQLQFTVDGLNPLTNYTVWMEAYLINGKVRLSNNVTILTKPGRKFDKSIEQEGLKALGGGGGAAAAAGTRSNAAGSSPSYYAALIVIAVIATLCAVGFIILLVILLRKQSSAKASITSAKSHSAVYDNPTYKDSMD